MNSKYISLSTWLMPSISYWEKKCPSSMLHQITGEQEMLCGSFIIKYMWVVVIRTTQDFPNLDIVASKPRNIEDFTLNCNYSLLDRIFTYSWTAWCSFHQSFCHETSFSVKKDWLSIWNVLKQPVNQRKFHSSTLLREEV